MCIWNTPVEDRHCEYCSYPDCRDIRTVLQEREELYIGVMSDIIGYNVLARTRKRAAAWARAMIAYQLRRDGSTLYRIGAVLGINHATVVYALKNVNRMLDHPRMFPLESNVWREFQERISL